MARGSNTGVIYTITHKPSGRIYVGSSKNVVERMQQHLSALRRQSHHCKMLQAAWIEGSPHDFSYFVVEHGIDLNMLLAREQNWFWRNEGRLLNTSHVAWPYEPTARRKMTTKPLQGNNDRNGFTIPRCDSSLHRREHSTFRVLFDRIGVSRLELSRRTGICERRIRYLHAGFKELKGVRTEVLVTYPEQVILELLAEYAAMARG